MGESHWVMVKSCATGLEADMVVTQLQQAGIRVLGTPPERIDEADEEGLGDGDGPGGAELHDAVDGEPQDVEIGEVHDLAVEIGAPVAVDHDRQEQPGSDRVRLLQPLAAAPVPVCF